MKLKQSPDDFFVEELTTAMPGEAGPFALYRLEKRGWTTPDALEAIRRRWDIADGRRVAYGGLKDRHAHTIQYITIEDGPRRGLEFDRITLRYLGQFGEPYASDWIRANRFRLELRAMTSADAEAAVARLAEVERDGLPNYFDDQRFGSVGPGRVFVAGEMVRGRYNEALQLALAGPYEFDRADVKREKELLRRHWGDWPTLKRSLERGHARSLVSYLADHPEDFAGALARLRPELRGLYLSAYQSDLWNRTLARWLETHTEADQRVGIRFKLGTWPAPRDLPAETRATLESLRVPLASPRLIWDEEASWAPALRSVLEEERIELAEMRLKGFRHPYFSKGDRAALIRPERLTATTADDDRQAGRRLLRLAFDLPRGCYATLLVKRLTAVVE
jgi:tRNA pseudouridine13 synthase